MYWRKQPADVAAARAAAFPDDGNFNSDAIGQYSDLKDKYGSYFRLNIFGMQEYRNHMEARGMLTWDIPDELYRDEDDHLLIDAETGGVMPGHKFCSNDGWVVTPSEITNGLEALEAWEKQQRAVHGESWTDPLRDEDDGYWDKWIRFLYMARSHGGVEVF